MAAADALGLNFRTLATCRDTQRVSLGAWGVRGWELEALLLGEFRLTLPPGICPLDEARRADQVRWRQDTLAEARRELGRAGRARWVATLALWRS